MEGFPREFLPTKNHQTVKDVEIPIPISAGQDLISQPYTFEFHFNSVDSPYIDFSNSYLELVFTMDVDESFTFTNQGQISNLYAIIDKITIDLLYVSPTGQDISVNYTESSIESSKARKFVALKELSKEEIDKSMYSNWESLYSPQLGSFEFMKRVNQKFIHVQIPLMLITGLGTFDCAIKVKSLKMQFVTNTLKNLFKPQIVFDTKFHSFKLERAYMNFREVYDINWGSDTRSLIKCVPNNCQISTYTQLMLPYESDAVTSEILVNRSVNFVPDYAMLFFTNFEKSMIPSYTDVLIGCQFQIGGQNILSKTDFPVQRCPVILNKYSDMDESQKEEFKKITFPNAMFYNTWRANSHPQSPLNGMEWYSQPIYLFPISSVVDVNTRSGCEVNIHLKTTYCMPQTGTVLDTTYKRGLFAHFIFVKFVRDGAMN